MTIEKDINISFCCSHSSLLKYEYIKKVIKSCNNKDQFYTIKNWLIKLHKQKIISDMEYLLLDHFFCNCLIFFFWSKETH